ncbi:MAG: acyl-CoA dehydrogenase [Desulfomonilia bacterium]|jgi:alkylation response protein AidB-like acyl-CoA dehydrogenase|uniref:Acyl-CoA dehydrogenase, short-chain specific (Butyryl-CoA dehydrogenase) n=1 Tax=anaerobic digester metagenome TaxID=1263854 RepID=A0A485LYJ8_9ZZZZ|nr:acyl-CoA dehydrogenase [Pseudomonadota bacterium]HPD21494.1 acyl-CoA dehydrogenase [Deltaproteobacteria bacterium]HRS56388.1 acyl-CoA dehydrogenase [Desulfomonilia bacterium]HRV36120.1 acyl-CoA dehydrogenase [Desulfomonilia bacterium]
MDFSLSEEHKMVRDMARKFADQELKPIAARIDQEHRHDDGVLRKMAENGFMGVAIPAEYGGAGMDYVAYALILTEISRACASTGVIMSVNNSLYGFPVYTFGTEEQKIKFNTPVASGEANGCYGLTEANAGSDPAGMKTSAVLDGDSWVINGEKKFITNGNIAKYAVIAAVTDKTKGYKGITQFVVDLENTEGFSVGKVEEKLGIRGSGTAELVFQDARIPKDSILGDPGSGFKQMLTTLDSGRIGIASQALGIAKAALEESVNYSKERVQFGKPISSFQATQFKLADMATRIDASELLILKAAWLESNHLPFEREAAQAKMFASDTAMDATIEAVQILGGYGYSSEYPVERLMRDAKITQIYEGTNEIMRVVISRNVLGMR